jgi:uncharacterized protein (DUF2141 family)
MSSVRKPIAFILVWFILFTTYSFTKQHSTNTGKIKVVVTNIKNLQGQIGFSLYKNSEGFPHPEKASLTAFVRITGSSCEYTFTNIEAGTYAIGAFHDENNDKILNSNFLGIPAEGVGVSNNAKGHFSPPKFDAAKFDFTLPEKTITISLSYF